MSGSYVFQLILSGPAAKRLRKYEVWSAVSITSMCIPFGNQKCKITILNSAQQNYGRFFFTADRYGFIALSVSQSNPFSGIHTRQQKIEWNLFKGEEGCFCCAVLLELGGVMNCLWILGSRSLQLLNAYRNCRVELSALWVLCVSDVVCGNTSLWPCHRYPALQHNHHSSQLERPIKRPSGQRQFLTRNPAEWRQSIRKATVSHYSGDRYSYERNSKYKRKFTQTER